MKKQGQHRGFALIVTLVLMALIIIIVVAYLANTRSDRSTSSIYANRLRAKMIADSGLVAATKLLHDNTKTGKYITAMPAPATPPAPLRTELYRPDNATISEEFLRLDNAIGEVLASRVSTVPLTAPTPQVDPRPAQTPMPVPPAGGSFGLVEPLPTPSTTDSFDFNQIVRVGTSASGRLVDPAGQPAFGQWIRVRNTVGELIGRYAFFVEDESMKVNVNVAGNRLGTGQSHLRTNDLIYSTPTPTPAGSPSPTPQAEQVFPSAVLPVGSNRQTAVDKLTAEGSPPKRLPSTASIAILDEWKVAYPEYAHLLTGLSRSDNTTARGWLRMDLNKVVADAEAVGTNAAKVTAALKIADWIKDAWTGPTAITALGQDPDGNYYQLYNDERLRRQIAASIVDYIDADDLPTDMGDFAPGQGLTPVPVIGIERIPQLENVMVIYSAKDRAPVPSSSPARTSAKMSMKVRLNFINMFDSTLDLLMPVSQSNATHLFDRVEVKGIPIISKNSEDVFDKSTTNFPIPITSFVPVKTQSGLSATQIPAGQDGVSASGIRSFESGWLVQDVPVTFRSNTASVIFKSGQQMTVKVFGPNNALIGSTAMTWNDTPNTGFRQSGTTVPGSDSSGDFLRDEPPATPGVERKIAALFHQENVTGSLDRQFGDPRYRPIILNDRWRRQNRSDTITLFPDPPNKSALDAREDDADLQQRTAGFDWYDSVSDRPLTFIRNGPMRSVGELGNIAASEYPWRSLYLQHPDRAVNSANALISTEVATLRRMNSVDWVLMDLFRTSSDDMLSGQININSTRDVSGQQRVLNSLVLGIPAGEAATTQQTLSDSAADFITTNTTSGLVTSLALRRTGSPTTPENNPARPFFQIGELAPALSRLVSLSTRVAGESRSTVTYSALRNAPANTGEFNRNYRSDMLVEQPFREISDSITTRGNVFRVLYVGQAIHDISRNGVKNGQVDGSEEIAAEFLGEAFVLRTPTFTLTGTNPDARRTSDSRYTILASRVITE